MKKTLIILLALSFLSCQKKKTTPTKPNGTCAIYSTNTLTTLKWGIIDQGTNSTLSPVGPEIGILHKQYNTPACGDTSFTTVSKPEGTYYFAKKSYDGYPLQGPYSVTIKSGECTSLNLH